MRKNRNLLIIALIAVVNALGYGIIIPILYTYSKKFGLSDFDNGLLFSIFSVFQFVSTPIIGRLSDKYGRKPLLIASITGTALSFFLMAFAPGGAFLFIARALDGLTAGNIPVASAVISDTLPPEERAKGFGIIGGSFGFGLIFGPAISGLTLGFGEAVPFIIAGSVSLLAVILTALLLPETNKHLGEVKKGHIFDFRHLLHALFDENIGLTLVITFVYMFSFSLFIYAFQPFSVHILHLSAQQIAFIFTLFGILGLVTQVLVVQKFVNLFGLKKAFASGLFLIGFSFLVMFLTRSFIVFILASMLLAFSNSLIQPLIQTILSQVTDAKSQGSILGLNSSYMSLGQILGPLLGGVLATYLIPLPFLGGSLLMFLAFILSFYIFKGKVHKESAF